MWATVSRSIDYEEDYRVYVLAYSTVDMFRNVVVTGFEYFSDHSLGTAASFDPATDGCEGVVTCICYSTA